MVGNVRSLRTTTVVLTGVYESCQALKLENRRGSMAAVRCR